MASNDLSKAEQNFTCFTKACIDFIKLPLIDILTDCVKPVDLYVKIKCSSVLMNGKNKLRPDQLKLCFHPPPILPDYSKFDVTLLYTLIRNLCPSLTPTRGWGLEPNNTDKKIGDDIERLRLFRNNFYAHADSTEILDSDFNNLWKNLQSVIQRIETFTKTWSTTNYEQELTRIKGCRFGYDDRDHYRLLLEATLFTSKSEEKDEPDILITGEDRVVCGDSARFDAEVKRAQLSEWSITWQKKTDDITRKINTSDKKYKGSSRSQLVIQSVCKDDEAEYQAILSNGSKLNIISNIIYLQALGEHPVFDVWDIVTDDGAITIEYRYKVSEHSPQVYQEEWTKNREALDRIKNAYLGGQLYCNYFTIKSPTLNDKGTYSCTVTNAVGSASKDVTFDVPFAHISTESKGVFGSMTIFKSEVTSCPKLEGVEWQCSSDGKKFFRIDISTPHFHGSKQLDESPLLVISKTTFEDRLHYRLRVLNKIGRSFSNILYLDVKGSPPNIMTSHETYFEKYSIKLIGKVFLYDKCNATTDVVWTKNGNEIDTLNSGGKYSKVSTDDSSLTISDVNEHDAGSYQLTATNNVGSTQSDVIVLGKPQIYLEKTEDIDGCLVFSAVIESIPSANHAQWKVKGSEDDDYKQVKSNADEYKDISNSLPQPVLVIKKKELLKNKSFRIEVENFVGKSVKDIRDKVEETSTKKEGGILSEICNPKALKVRFNNLRLKLIEGLEEKDLQNLKQSIEVLTQTGKEFRDVDSISVFVSRLWERGVFQERNVIIMQYLMRSLKRMDLEKVCVNYAIKDQRALCYYENPLNQDRPKFSLHVVDDIENFTTIEDLRQTVADFVNGEPADIEVIDLRPDKSFIITMTMRKDLFIKLKKTSPKKLRKLTEYKVDWIQIEDKVVNITEDMHGHDISNWKEDDTVFVETHSFSAMLKKVRNQPFMTFVGAPGSGKTATVRHIALKLQEEGYEIVQLRDIKDVETYCDPYNPQVFVIDDVLGMFDLVISEFHLLCKYQNILRGPIMSKTKTLMTCREAVFKNEVLSNCFWSKQENVIQMHDHANAISYKDRHKLLLKYNLDDPDSILQINPQFLSKMFPKLCAVFSKRKEYMKTQEGTLFSFPIPCILEELDEMKSRNKIHYASLVLMMANDRKLSKEDLDNTDLSTSKNSVIKKKDSLLTACEVSYFTESCEFISALIEMNGIYTKNSGSGFSFINNLMFEITAKHFGCLFPKLILQCMSSSYIANYVKLRKSDIEEQMSKDKTLEDKMRIDKKVSQKLKAMNELCIILQESEYPLFASRLYGKIRNLEVNVFENEALKHPVVLHAFIEKMKRTPFQKLYFLYFSKLKVTEKLKSYVCEQEKYSPNEVVNIEIQCLLLMDEYRRSPLRISVGAICYVLYYGHHQILQYIIDQLREKGKVDNLFKNAYNENIRFYRHVLATSGLSGESDDSSDNEGDYQTTFTDTYSESDIESMSAAHLRLLNLATYSGDIATVHLLMTYVDKEILHATGSNISNLIFKPLHIACKFGYSKIATSLVKAGCDVNLATNFLSTPLIIACDGGHMCIVQMLIREGADVNLNNKYRTPLVAACSKGYISIVQELIKRGAHVNLSSRDAKYEEEIGMPFDLMFDSWERSFSTGGLNAMFEDVFKPRFPNERNQTPLTAACYNGYMSIVQVLTEAGADVNQSDGHQNPLIAACLNGHLSIVKTLLKAGADINQLIDQQNPLIAACFNGHLNIVETLLKAGFDVNQRKGDPNPLIAACAQGYSSIVETLLKAGYDANQTDGHKTPLLAACLNGHLSTVETLLEAGSNINHKCDRETPLKAACLRKYFDIVHRLLKAGVKIIWDVYIYELLTAACFEGHLLVVRELINARIDVNQSDGRQKPLIAACLKGHINVVEELIKAGANVNQSIGKETPLTAATTAGHLNIVERLIKAGADVNLKDKETTPIKAAYDKGHLAIVEKLKEAGADVSK